MLSEDIRSLWDSFINDYEQYFVSNEESWTIKLDELKAFINLNERRPNNIYLKCESVCLNLIYCNNNTIHEPLIFLLSILYFSIFKLIGQRFFSILVAVYLNL